MAADAACVIADEAEAPPHHVRDAAVGVRDAADDGCRDPTPDRRDVISAVQYRDAAEPGGPSAAGAPSPTAAALPLLQLTLGHGRDGGLTADQFRKQRRRELSSGCGSFRSDGGIA